ncbi:hypothetical protein PVBG_04514 [Plasmodium vivax Brazil I]|uniref:PIR Superfamily Protein n=1 Tax=Plasmodium vivax (strain Brazil I) TaxID=1033975 RepID=A0A0J9SVK0_PLAV1|nr:hypothetical protein PVBG_04514 [Plasmodium vivax Brazil I]
MQKNAYPQYFNYDLNDVRTQFYKISDEYISEIKKIKDPILRHVALYLVENYEEIKDYFSKDKKWANNLACKLLNRWLDQKKAFFTFSENCKENLNSWTQYIDPIWNKLESNNTQTGCPRKEIFAKNVYIPKEFPPTCYKHVPNNYNCTQPLRKNAKLSESTCSKIEKDCNRCVEKGYIVLSAPLLQTDIPETCSITDTTVDYSSLHTGIYCKECPSEIMTIAISVCVTFFGTFFILFFLYKVN